MKASKRNDRRQVDGAVGFGSIELTAPSRDGREHAIRLLDELGAGQRPRWTLVDAAWTPTLADAASRENGNTG